MLIPNEDGRGAAEGGGVGVGGQRVNSLADRVNLFLSVGRAKSHGDSLIAPARGVSDRFWRPGPI